MEMREYLEVLREQIRCVKVRDLVEDEVGGHIKDQAEIFIKEGMGEEEAFTEAVRQMGDPVEAGVALDRVHRPGMDWKLLILVGLLSAAGLVIQYGLCRESGDFSLLWKQFIYQGVGIAVMWGICLVDYSVIGKYVIWLWGVLSAGFLVVILWGPVINGGHLYAKNYMYLYVPVFAGILYHYRGGGYRALLKCGIFHGMAMLIGLNAVSVPVCLDVTAICLILVSVGVWKRWFAVPRGVVLVVLWGGIVLIPVLCFMTELIRLQSYQMTRIMGILNPKLDPMGSGYNINVIRTAIKDSTWLGHTGGSLQGWLGGLNTDYVLVHLISDYGLIACGLLLTLFALFLIHIISSMIRQKNQLGQMVGMGCYLVFAIQTLHYVMLNLGIGFMALGMPFISSGGSVVITTYILTGLLLSIYRFKNISPERKAVGGGKYRLHLEKADSYLR